MRQKVKEMKVERLWGAELSLCPYGNISVEVRGKREKFGATQSLAQS